MMLRRSKSYRKSYNFLATAPFLASALGNSAPLSNQGPMFAGQPITLAGALREVAYGDIDQDGDLDLVVVSSSTDEAIVMVNNGYGQFEVVSAISGVSLFDRPEGVALADLNTDGYPDLVVSNFGSNSVSILLNDQEGSYIPQIPNVDVGNAPKDVAISFIDDDDFLDIIVANSGDDEVQVLLGDGAGNFTSLGTVAAGDIVQRLEIDDLDQDGRNDVIAVSDQRVIVLRNLGGGTLVEIENINLNPQGPRDVAIADFDNDSYLDLVIANNGLGSTTSRIMFNSGNGTFSSQSDIFIGTSHRAVGVLDADADGDMDFVVAGTDDGLAHVLLNDGEGGFGFKKTYFIGDNPWSILSEDLDGDGISDIVVSNRQSSDLSLLLGVGDSTFYDQNVLDSGAGSQVMFVDSGDANGDGFMDFVVAHSTAENSENIQLFLYDEPTGLYTPGFSFNAGISPNHVVFADLSAAIGLDIVATSGNDNRVTVLFNDGIGGYGQEAVLTTTAGPIQSASARLDNNITTDIATVDTDGGTVSIFYNDGDSSFTPGNFAVGTNPFGIVMGDLNNNGLNDIAITLLTDNLLKIYWNDGTGGFSSINFDQFPIPLNPRGISLADFDGINGLDIAVSSLDGESVYVLLNNGLGNFSFHPSSPFSVGNRPIHIDTGDLDADGDIDIVAAALNESAVDVLINDGSGGFSLEGQFRVGEFPRSISVADFDGDGVGDIISGSNSKSTVSILQNLRSGIAYWSGPGSQFDDASNWFGGLSPQENPFNVVIFDQSVGGMVPDQFPTLDEDEDFQGLGLASLNVNLNLKGNDLDLLGDHPIGQNALVLGLRQAGPGPVFPPFGVPTLSLQNTTPSVVSSVNTRSLVIGESGPAELKMTLLGEQVDLVIQDTVLVGLGGNGTLELRGDTHRFFYGDPILTGESIVVGSRATGIIEVANGAIVNEGLDLDGLHNGVDRFVIGEHFDAMGMIRVAGGGFGLSQWNHKGESLIIGERGYGQLLIESGGIMNSSISSILLGAELTSMAEVNIDGVGSAWIDPSGTLNMGGQGTAFLNVTNDGLLDLNSIRNLSQGTIQGNGTFSAIVVNYGDIVVGDPQILNPDINQTLTIEGELRQYFDPADLQLSGRLFIDLNETDGVVASDKVVVIGDALLGGSLIVTSTEQLDLKVGQVLPVIEAVAPIGDFRFDVALLPSLSNGRYLRIVYDDPSLTTPEMQGSVALIVDSLSDIELGVPSNFTPSGVPKSAELGDLNADGFDDLAILVPDDVDPVNNNGQLVVLLNAQVNQSASNWPGLSGGTLVLPTLPNPTDLDIGNLDLLNGNDIAVSNAGGMLQVFINSGASAPSVGFDPAQDFSFDLAIESVHITDLDSDGYVDLTVAGSNFDTIDGSVGMMLNAGVTSDNWNGFGSIQLYEVGERPVDIASADLDLQDGNDLVIANFGSDNISLLKNLGTDIGGWNGFGQSAEIQVGNGPSIVFARDLDEEKDLDLVVLNQTQGTLSIILQNDLSGADLSDSFGASATFPVGENPLSAVLWDSDSDGDLDPAFIVENETGSRVVRLFRNLAVENASSGNQGLSFVLDQDIASNDGPLIIKSGQLNADDGEDLAVIGVINGSSIEMAMNGKEDLVGSVFLGIIFDCRADLTGDGELDFFDVSLFLSAFLANELAADFTDDGVFDFFDVSAFLSEFSIGCP